MKKRSTYSETDDPDSVSVSDSYSSSSLLLLSSVLLSPLFARYRTRAGRYVYVGMNGGIRDGLVLCTGIGIGVF